MYVGKMCTEQLSTSNLYNFI